MKTPLRPWCGFLVIFYKQKVLFCKLYAKSFLAQLENAINNNLPITNIEMPCDKFKINLSEFDKQYDEEELKEMGHIYFRIVNNIEKNKFKMDKVKKMKYSAYGVYWVAGSNYDFLNFSNPKNSASIFWPWAMILCQKDRDPFLGRDPKK